MQGSILKNFEDIWKLGSEVYSMQNINELQNGIGI